MRWVSYCLNKVSKMKYIIIRIGAGLSIVFSSVTVYAQNIPFTIKVESISPWPNSMVFLSYVKPGEIQPGLDSVKLVNGKALIKGSTLKPQKALIYIERANKGFIANYTKASRQIYLEKGTIVFSTPRDVTDARLSGTPLNNDLQSYTDVLGKFKHYQDSLSNQFRVAYRDKVSTDLSRLNKEFKVLDSAKRKAELEHFSKRPNSVVSLEWLEMNINIARQKLQAQRLFATLSKDVRESAGGKAYAALLDKTAFVSVGFTAPDFRAKTIDDEDLSLSSFKGKYVLLDFWASWCGPCRAENPNVLKAYNAFKDQNFTVLGFSMDESKEAWKRAVKADGMPWAQISDLKAWKGEVSKLYGIEGIPANFLIDPNGKIIGRDLRGDQLERELNRILK